MKAYAGKRVLIIVENLPLPFDRRVWHEATTLQKNGYEVTIISPKRDEYQASEELLEGVHIWRHPLPVEGDGAVGFFAEYLIALFWEFFLALKLSFTRGFDVIHACNPPDTIFIIGLFFKLFGKKFIFDHHDINPELYVAKFGRKDIFHKILCLAEKLTFKTADISIATNDSYRNVAIGRGGMSPEDVFVVRSGPNLNRMFRQQPVEKWKSGRKFMVGYVGVMGGQEGIDLLLEIIRYLVYDLGRSDIHFCLVGGGPVLEEMRKLSVDLDVDDYVNFLGRVDDATYLEVLNTADVCVNPDTPNEMNDKSTMNKVLEYMALGKPVVQFDLQEGRYSCEGASLYAKCTDTKDFADHIIKLVDDDELREKMGGVGRLRIENVLSWGHQVPILLRAYKAVMLKS
ncbi:MAG: glycosyltransferase WbuB [Gammaproteobacteria bacterium]|nr:glycosyltransferase family 4 protein [Gammaproteobacteria bacterium]PCH63997.1 MAG: glycosyltransferase WbuB [Gammaproteobacteria bacterium]